MLCSFGYYIAMRSTRRDAAARVVRDAMQRLVYYQVSTAVTTNRADLSELGRFADPSLLILTSLAGGPKHGHAMIQDIAAMSGVRLGPGTLYGALVRLEQRGLIAPLPAEERRRPYQLTGLGAAALRERLTSLASVAATGLARLATSLDTA
jgi:DNA-binding PadR family transcriptional regulator